MNSTVFKAFNSELVHMILLDPIVKGADKLIIVSGYATNNMASWHIKKICDQSMPHSVSIELLVGMCPSSGLDIDVHEGFKSLVESSDETMSSLCCKYIYNGYSVHSKVYIWLKGQEPIIAFTGSANYTQSGFGAKRREYMVPCDHKMAYQYYLGLDKDSIYCNHAEVEEYVKFTKKGIVKKLEEDNKDSASVQGLNKKTLSLLTKFGDVGHGSGINWGHRRDGTKRDPNQTYIPLPRAIAKTGYFPLDEQHFTVITDDHKQLILRVEQEGDKAITTPMSNSLLGEYFRNRIGVASGAFVTKDDLEKYGRTDVTFYKIDEEQFYMDFSV
ncbi:MAG: restriction endonuclease PLD domain-containing protein [Rikenellaceae bacterium]